MNLSRPLVGLLRRAYREALAIRRLLRKQRCHTLGPSSSNESPQIGRIYVINLDRQPERLAKMNRELRQVLDSSGTEIRELTVRYSAVDARTIVKPPVADREVDPVYTLRDQLFVEPQPRVLPDRFHLDQLIQMSRSEVAVARSHIGVWRQVAAGHQEFALVIEDDVWFRPGFARYLDRAWREMIAGDGGAPQFDILYLSYSEVKHGAQKDLLSRCVFSPVRGLWYLSGYVVSRSGARKLLESLPCRGPVDLWANHKFEALEVRATRRPIISQRRDVSSTNTHSILPVLTGIGVLEGGADSLYGIRPPEPPVFAFGDERSGLTSLALALSMLGYRCCSDLQDLPAREMERVLAGQAGRLFDAYVNIGSLEPCVRILRDRYAGAKFIVVSNPARSPDAGLAKLVDILKGCDVAVLYSDASDKWKGLCEHLRCPPPICAFPEVEDLGKRRLADGADAMQPAVAAQPLARDESPWILDAHPDWNGISYAPVPTSAYTKSGTRLEASLDPANMTRWYLRDDTFPSNLALFRPSNVEFQAEGGAVLLVRREALGVRDYSAASISSCDRFLYGRFEATLQATNVPGLVTGFFLHRDSPRQEIDVEIMGNRPNRLVVNVFYNPGDEGAKFDYGYRGSPSSIELGFDASSSPHRFAIEWYPNEIRWLVDDQLVHRRANWDPTPIPHLPMTLHVNTWPSRSSKLAGRLARRQLPAAAVVRSFAIDATLPQTEQRPRIPDTSAESGVGAVDACTSSTRSKPASRTRSPATLGAAPETE